jgi:ferredoxin-NADP reductase
MNNFVDRTLNRITMYRLMLYYAIALAAAALGLSAVGLLPQHALPFVFSLALIAAVCWLANRAFAALFRVPVNAESVYITALLLALIMAPVTATDLSGIAALVLAALVAIASKFLIAVGRKHIFNPVAIGAAASALLLARPPTWWVGNEMLLPFVLVGGLLVARKLQRFDMIGVYILANLAATLLLTPLPMASMAFKATFFYSPLLFVGFAMLTEPLTAPHGKISRLIYGAAVGFLSSPSLHIGGFYITPELALLAGNLYAFAAGPRGRYKLTLLRIERTAAGCYDFVFRPDRMPPFRPGQYLDWTLDVPSADSRGNRRPFTIASAPTEPEIRLGVKFYERPSAFKRTLLEMQPGDVIFASQLAGSFTLPADRAEKLAFIAGGIGVTPFRSMVQELVNRHERRPIVMLYGANRPDELAYADLFDEAADKLGLKMIYAVAEGDARGPAVVSGFIDQALIRREIPDFLERTFYISGPRAMVLRFRRALAELGVARSRIKVDFFPGFA